MGYSKEEQETNLNFDYSTGVWTAYSTVPKHIRKLQKIANVEVEVIESENNRPIAIRATLTEKMVSMRKEREVSDEQRARMSDLGSKLGNRKN